MLKNKIYLGLLMSSFVLFMMVIFTGPDTMAAEPNLYWGSRGTAVVEVQQALNAKGYWCGSADGIFGAKTYSAVIKFQQNMGLQVDGIVGPQTRNALFSSRQAAAVSRSGSTVSRSGSSVNRSGNVISMVATGYCSCNKCNYPYGGQPSYLGYPLRRGIVAVDPKVIPMGKKLYVEGYGEAIAADQGNAIKGNRIDLCFSSHQEALNWGIRTVKVTVY